MPLLTTDIRQWGMSIGQISRGREEGRRLRVAQKKGPQGGERSCGEAIFKKVRDIHRLCSYTIQSQLKSPRDAGKTDFFKVRASLNEVSSKFQKRLEPGFRPSTSLTAGAI